MAQNMCQQIRGLDHRIIKKGIRRNMEDSMKPLTIVEQRNKKPFLRTKDLEDLVFHCYPKILIHYQKLSELGIQCSKISA